MSNLNINNNSYWQKISSDGKISQKEVSKFTENRTGLSKEEATAGKTYLEAVLGNKKYVDVNQINIEYLDQAIHPNKQPEDFSSLISRLSLNLNVSKGGGSENHSYYTKTRENLIKNCKLSLDNLPQDKLLDLKNNYIREHKGQYLRLNNAPEHLRTGASTSENFPLPSLSYWTEYEKFFYSNNLHIDQNHCLSIPRPMTEDILKKFKSFYSDKDPKRKEACALLDKLYSLSQTQGIIYFSGPMDKNKKEELLSCCQSPEDKQAIMDVYTNSWEITEKDIKNFNSYDYQKLEEEYVDSYVLEPTQFKDALFDILTRQLESKLPAENYDQYRQELSTYIDSQIKGWESSHQKDFILNIHNLYVIAYEWTLDFKEDIDISSPGEANRDEPFVSFMTTAQGPYSSTCGLYAVFSFLENQGIGQQVKDKLGVSTYGDLDLKTGEIIKENGIREEHMMDAPIFRQQGMTFSSMTEVAKKMTNGTSIQITLINDASEDISEVLKSYPDGLVATISTKVGPHAINVISISNNNVLYYDPIGKDGVINIHMENIDDFNKHFMPKYGLIARKDTNK